MAKDLFANLDLNLLKTLSVLAQEGNMRRASERLHVTQPAVSQALKKLRHHFGDELFVRTPSGMQPTSFTSDLMEDIEPVLDELSAALNRGQIFRPEDIDRAIHLVLAPHMAGYLSTRLFRAIRAESPQAELHLHAWSEESIASLAKGEQLLGLNALLETLPTEISGMELADDHYTVYVRENHPLLGRKDHITLSDLDGVEIASLIVPDFNTRVTYIERVLRANGYAARVGFRSAQSSAVTDVLHSTDMVYGASSFIDPANLVGLRALDIKINDQYLNRPVTAYFHRKNRNSPLVAWLLDLLRGLLQPQRAAPGPVAAGNI